MEHKWTYWRDYIPRMGISVDVSERTVYSVAWVPKVLNPIPVEVPRSKSEFDQKSENVSVKHKNGDIETPSKGPYPTDLVFRLRVHLKGL